ncbi:zinc ribbon domain-containing protein [Planktothrix agardhii]|uniref:zinc ribbon domain-containing protein n=1 Tax=Planktothrix agardhii TaxID=1160 RepID=UPI0039BF8046
MVLLFFGTKLNYKLALKGLKLIKRPAPYTSKSCSTCGVIGKRNRHDFNCPNGHYHNSDLNAARNLSQWDGFACDLNLKRDASVMDSSGLNYLTLPPLRYAKGVGFSYLAQSNKDS